MAGLLQPSLAPLSPPEPQSERSLALVLVWRLAPLSWRRTVEQTQRSFVPLQVRGGSKHGQAPTGRKGASSMGYINSGQYAASHDIIHTASAAAAATAAGVTETLGWLLSEDGELCVCKEVSRVSIRPMYRRCSHCGRSYNFNPSTKDLGLLCKHCGRPQLSPPSPFPLPPFPKDRFPR